MKKGLWLVLIVLVGLVAVQPIPAFAGSSARLIPTGQVSLMSGDKEVSQFRSEMPLPQGLLMVSSGNCLVQTQGLQLIAHDKAVFGLSEGGDRWNLTVKTGRVDFAMRSEVKPVTFQTPHDLIRTERVIISASSAGLVRGFIVVTENGTELSMEDGALQVVSGKGSELVKPGQSIVLAQHQLGPGQTGATIPTVTPTAPLFSAPLWTGAGVGAFAGTVAGSLAGGGVFEDKKPLSGF
jgi:hypothetical protein